MTETRSQKRAAQSSKPDNRSPIPKRARNRSQKVHADNAEASSPPASARYTSHLAPRIKGHTEQNPPCYTITSPHLVHVYLAGPAEFRAGFNDDENNRLDDQIERMMQFGERLAEAEIRANRLTQGMLRRTDEGVARDPIREEDRWDSVQMPDLKDYDPMSDARTWRYTAPPLPMKLDLGGLGLTESQKTMHSNLDSLPEWSRVQVTESFQLYRPEGRGAAISSHVEVDFPPISGIPTIPLRPEVNSSTTTPPKQKRAIVLLSPMSFDQPQMVSASRAGVAPDHDQGNFDSGLDNLPNFVWKWDQSPRGTADQHGKESLSSWRQSLSGSVSMNNKSKDQSVSTPVAAREGGRSDLGATTYLTDPSLDESAISKQHTEDTVTEIEGIFKSYKPLPLYLAPFRIPSPTQITSATVNAAEIPDEKGKHTKKQLKHPLESIRAVKPMRQELSPFILKHNATQSVPVALPTEVAITDRSGKQRADDYLEGPNNGSYGQAGQNVATESRANTYPLEATVEAEAKKKRHLDPSVKRNVTKGGETIESAIDSQRRVMKRLNLKDERFGRIFDMIPDPHSISVPDSGPAYLTVPNPAFYAPIKMPPSPHPFHPSLRDLVNQKPKLRVRWVVPIHGPVVLQGHINLQSKFLPSPAILASDNKQRTKLNEIILNARGGRKPQVHLSWTKETLQRFWAVLLKIRTKGTCGPVSFSVSGPYPDPFRLSPTPLGLERHRYLEEASIRHESRPVRCCAGDHIRISCDLEHALTFRMWLGITELDPNKHKIRDKQALIDNPFLRVKLCLVGPLGEVLAVI